MAIRQAASKDVFQAIYDRELAITSADEFARRHHRVNRKDAADFLRPEGTYQVYKSVPVEWAGRISKHPETDTRSDLDLWDGRTQAPDADPIKWVMLLQDRFSRKLYGSGLAARQTNI